MKRRTRIGLGGRLRAAARAFAWPQSGRLVREVPDWIEHWIGFALQLTQKQLGHVEAFFSVPMVNAGVRMLADDVASIRQVVTVGRGENKRELEKTGRLVDEGGNLADLLSYANPIETGRQLRMRTVGSLVLSGNAYWYLQRLGSRRQPLELWCLPGHRVRPVPGPKRTIAGYEFSPGDQRNWGVPRNLPAEDVIAFYGFNPEDRPEGVSDLEAVTQSYEAQYYALQWLKEFFRKGGTLSGVWTTDDEFAGRYTDEEVDEIIKRISEKHLGWDKAWNPVILQGLKFVQQGMKLQEMELDKQIALIDAKIIRALGIPPVMMGIKEGSAGLSDAGATTDKTNYWLGRIASLCSLIDDTITEKLCPLFGKDLAVTSDLESVLAIQNARLDQAKAHQILVGNRSIETVNEARKAIRLPARSEPEHDQLWERPIAPNPFADGSEPGKGEDPEAMRPGKDAGEGSEPKRQSRARLSAADQEREELRRRARVNLERFQGRFEHLVLERLADQQRTAKDRLRSQWASENPQLSAGLAIRFALDTGDLMEEPDEEHERRAQRLLDELLKARGAEALRDLEAIAGVALEIELDSTRQSWADFVRKQVDRAIRVPDQTTARLLRESLAQGLEAGEGLDQLLGRVDHVFEGRRSNALTIARTETQPAYVFSSMEAWEQSGMVEESEWLTSHSGRGGRHSENPDGRYDGLDGQIRKLGEFFDVGGVPMLYPGWPEGPPDQSINCVCTLLPRVAEAQLRARRWGRFLSGAHRNGAAKPTHRLARFFAGSRS